MAHSPLAQLTDREREVLEHMAQGKNNAAIAKSLFLTERAVEKHINSLFHKLGLSRRSPTSTAGSWPSWRSSARPTDAPEPDRRSLAPRRRVHDVHAARRVTQHEVRHAVAHPPPRCRATPRLPTTIVSTRSSAATSQIRSAGSPAPCGSTCARPREPLGAIRRGSRSGSGGLRGSTTRSQVASGAHVAAPAARLRAPGRARAASSTARSAEAEVSVPTRIFFIVAPPSPSATSP